MLQALAPETLAQLDAQLCAQAMTLGLALTDTQAHQLLDYLGLIHRWNQVYNLTAIRDAQQMLALHLVDSMAVCRPLEVQRASLVSLGNGPLTLLDVGSGAGLPGIVVAICCPNVQVTCVDKVGKKAAFIQQVAATLKLPNLLGTHARVETLSGPFDVVCSRAFASLVDFTTGSKASLASHGLWMAMKGKRPLEELAALPQDVQVFHVEPLNVPGMDVERCIVWMRRASAA